jgi:hypothetical protein
MAPGAAQKNPNKTIKTKIWSADIAFNPFGPRKMCATMNAPRRSD